MALVRLHDSDPALLASLCASVWASSMLAMLTRPRGRLTTVAAMLPDTTYHEVRTAEPVVDNSVLKRRHPPLRPRVLRALTSAEYDHGGSSTTPPPSPRRPRRPPRRRPPQYAQPAVCAPAAGRPGPAATGGAGGAWGCCERVSSGSRCCPRQPRSGRRGQDPGGHPGLQRGGSRSLWPARPAAAVRPSPQANRGGHGQRPPGATACQVGGAWPGGAGGGGERELPGRRVRD